MTYHGSAVNLGGIITVGASVASSLSLAFLAKVTAFAGTPLLTAQGAPDIASRAIDGSIAVGGIGIVTLLVNGAVQLGLGLYKTKRDTDQKIAESELRTSMRVKEALEAKEAADTAKAEKLRADLEDKAERARQEEELARQRRQAEREFTQTQLLRKESENIELRNQIAQLKEQFDRSRHLTRERSDMNSAAIATLADAAHIPVTVATEVPGETGEHATIPLDDLPRAPDPDLPRLLVIENELAALNALGRVLRFRGWDPILASSGLEAWPHAHSMSEDLDVVVVDLMLPDVSGVQIIKLIRGCHKYSRKTGKPVRIVAYTSCAEGDPLIAAAVAEGADAVVIKPCELEYLEDVLLGRSPGRVPIPARSAPDDPPQDVFSDPPGRPVAAT